MEYLETWGYSGCGKMGAHPEEPVGHWKAWWKRGRIGVLRLDMN